MSCAKCGKALVEGARFCPACGAPVAAAPVAAASRPTEFHLLGYVMQAMEEIKAGTFWVNDPLTDNEAGPFGGMRQSGIGRELGVEGLEAFREPKHVHIDYIQERKSYWFPYAKRPW